MEASGESEDWPRSGMRDPFRKTSLISNNWNIQNIWKCSKMDCGDVYNCVNLLEIT